MKQSTGVYFQRYIVWKFDSHVAAWWRKRNLKIKTFWRNQNKKTPRDTEELCARFVVDRKSFREKAYNGTRTMKKPRRPATLQHCPMSTATTHIGSSCACSGGQSRFWSRFGKWFGQSKAVPISHPQPIIPLFRACRHCDSEVVIHSTNGHIVLSTHLLSLSKIWTLLREFYTMRFIK